MLDGADQADVVIGRWSDGRPNAAHVFAESFAVELRVCNVVDHADVCRCRGHEEAPVEWDPENEKSHDATSFALVASTVLRGQLSDRSEIPHGIAVSAPTFFVQGQNPPFRLTRQSRNGIGPVMDILERKVQDGGFWPQARPAVVTAGQQFIAFGDETHRADLLWMMERRPDWATGDHVPEAGGAVLAPR